VAISQTDPRPLFQQIVDELKHMILLGNLKEGERAPSTNELSIHHSVNPTTSAKALTLLNTEGLVEKKRGVGMFVTEGARERIREQRQRQFHDNFVAPLLEEAQLLGLTVDEVIADMKETESTRPRTAAEMKGV